MFTRPGSNPPSDSSAAKRMRLVKALSTSGANRGTEEEPPPSEIFAIGLGDRMVISEQAEVWTIKGVFRTGSLVPEPVGEISFVMIPGQYQPATAVVGYICPREPYQLNLADELIWPQIRGMITQLGYDLDGFYVSLSIRGKPFYRKEFIETKTPY